MTSPTPTPADADAVQRELDLERRSNRRKDEFLGTLAHELRNALTPIRIALQILGMPGMDTSRSRDLRDATDRQLVRMVRMIDDLMDVSQLSRGKVKLHRERLELATVVDNAVELTRSAIEEGAHTLQVQVPDEPLIVDGDATRLAQVFGILLVNAAKYTDRGGQLKLTVARGADQSVEVAVEDNGIGIEPGELQSMFELFAGRDGPAKRAHDGLGIGLAMAHGLVSLHGGTIQAHSEGQGRGSRFVVRLPLAEGTQTQ